MADLLSTVVGFASGWGLFELSEFRRRWMNRRAIRRSVVAELTSAEVVLSGTVFDLSVAADDLDRAATEFRWLKDYGGFPVAIPESAETLTDQQLKEVLRKQKKIQTWDEGI